MTTKTTMHLGRAASWLDRLALPPAFVVALVVLLVAAGISAAGRLASHAPAAAVPTPMLPVILIATAQPAPVPTAAPVVQVAAVEPPVNTTRRAIVVYGSPDPASAIGAVEAGRAYQVLARHGADWLQLDMTGSGVVYARASDLYNLPAGLADLAPTEAPIVVYVAAQAAPADAAPTYSAPAASPTPDWYTTPPHVEPEFQQALIGSDPNALACGGSPICGGLTNAEAAKALEQQGR